MPTPAEVRAARQRLGLTQAELAARLGVDVMTISRWERGARTPPPYLAQTLAALENAKNPALRRARKRP